MIANFTIKIFRLTIEFEIGIMHKITLPAYTEYRNWFDTNFGWNRNKQE